LRRVVEQRKTLRLPCEMLFGPGADEPAGFSQKQSIFSSSISRSISPKASEPSESIERSRSGSISGTLPVKLLPMLTPPLTAPPLRVLAPKPSSFASSTTASMPCLANSSAADSPA